MEQHNVQDMAAIVAKLNLHFPRSGGLLNEQVISLAEDWAEDLAEFPMPVIRQAVKLCRRDEHRRYFPTIGEFAEYCRIALVEYRRFTQKRLPENTGCDNDESKRQAGLDRLREIYQRNGWWRTVNA